MLFLMGLTLIVYLSMPIRSTPSMPFYYFCLSVYVIATIFFFIGKKRNNYFDFDFIFVTIYSICSFFATAFYEEPIVYRALYLGLAFDENYVNIGNLLSLLGIIAYYSGGLSYNSKRNLEIEKRKKPISSKYLSYLLMISIVAFIALGGVSYYKSVYLGISSNHSTFVTHVLLLINSLSIVITTTEFYNRKIFTDYKIRKSPFVFVIAFSLLLLYCGNRTSASYILLPILGIYTTLFRKISMANMFLVLSGAIVLMWIIGQFRIGNSGETSMNNMALLCLDLSLPSRNNYIVYDYVKDNGFSLGSSMIGGVISLIPFLSSVFKCDDSGTLLTEYYYSQVRDPNPVGLGTTITADIYMAFGVIGVVMLMFLLGRLVTYYYCEASKMKYDSLIVVALIMAFSVYLVRAPYVMPFRYIFYCLIISLINRKFILKK